MEVRSGQGIARLVAGLLFAIAVFGVVDISLDGPGAWRTAHGIVELGFIGLCLGSALFLGWNWSRSDRDLGLVRSALEDRQRERDEWRERTQSVLRGLGAAIDVQFEAWKLTPVEKETALLLLKGFSHKEIAALGERSERTVRQHAVQVYRKSGLGGRAELSAFFLEDLLLPHDATQSDDVSR
jgi:DNA-binding CsgD family transcriptional regulator